MSQESADGVSNQKDGVAGPFTINQDVIWLRGDLEAARAMRGMPIDLQVVADASGQMRRMRLIPKSAERDRRPTAEELDALTEYFSRRDQRAEIPMLDVMEFAIAGARRQEEITRLGWSGLNEAHRTALIRQVKQPRRKATNDRVSKLTDEAWAIIQRQPCKEGEDRIFPYNDKSISSAFTRACKVLGIEDLHFHDLRHEATSRLFEAGYQIQEVAQFTLHGSWATMKRYTHLRRHQTRKL